MNSNGYSDYAQGAIDWNRAIGSRASGKSIGQSPVAVAGRWPESSSSSDDQQWGEPEQQW